MSFRDYQAANSKQYHIQVAKGEVGRYVFLPGDPFRTDLIASFLDDAKHGRAAWMESWFPLPPPAWAAPLRQLQ